MSINKLENFLDNLDNQEIAKTLLENYEQFDYDNEYLFNLHLQFLLENCYNIKLIENKRKRLNQKEFRKLLFKKFNGQCIVSHNDCEHELKAAHIVPIADGESYDIDNGLLLTSTLHDTMDKFLWAINPETLQIEIKENKNVGQIKNYNGQKIKLKLNQDLKNNLMVHYNKFINY